ncbi:FAD/NAD-P-binding domain-containing protein [Trametes versicolor FP-101664 SS1]|uniref:FAD/NAD-P-binding domain-containing protein n=1 Tax=Trametes versicolor (strain FP-101664) TaxID=717944 RepID=UPI00046239FF|nr:FAD/NAD-P-binding domain-containing protein [Trametes versicolor FP-101664 SS1]EIW52781.1 FAD/NAD-P-binding domain-containing protein [Trametes versicolor FP-101664 SS1]
MSTPSPPKFRVAIVGAGIGGLLLALFLQKDAPDVAVEIYESTAQLVEVGAGIGFWPRMWEMFIYLGLEDDLLKISGSQDGSALPVHYRKADEPTTIEFHKLAPALRTFHRADLQRLLAKNFHAGHIHFGKRLVRYDAPDTGTGPITLQFTDDTRADCEVLVGADGIRSAARRSMYEAFADEAGRNGEPEEAQRSLDMADPVWSREISYRGLVSAHKLAALGFKDADLAVIDYDQLFGKNKHLMSYPICEGTLINVAAFVSFPTHEGEAQDSGPWVSAASAEDVVRAFEGWDPNVRTLLEAIERPVRWSIHECHYLPTCVRDRVVLIGDAAHAMRPHQGAGAGQAMEDGFILAAILAHASVSVKNLNQVLRVYDTLRRPAAQDIQRRSELNGTLYQLRSTGWEDVTEEQSQAGGFSHEKLADVGRQVERQMEWVLEGSVMEEKRTAVEAVERKLALSELVAQS